MAILYFESLPKKLHPTDLVRWMSDVGDIPRRDVGNIELYGRQASCEVPNRWELPLVGRLDGEKLRGQRIHVWSSAVDASNEEPDHFQRLSQLLQVESHAEARQAYQRAQLLDPQQAEETGQSLVNLKVLDYQDALGGRIVVQLAKPGAEHLPWNRLTIGTPIALTAEQGRESTTYRGVISERDAQCIWVALEEYVPELGGKYRWRIDLAYDETVVQRQQAALRRARLAQNDRLAELREVLLGNVTPRFRKLPSDFTIHQDLNNSQQDAVALACSAMDVALIHGPPGTGKTTAVVEVIRQAVASGQRVLACGPSNRATDNLLQRLLALGIRVLRIGHPARVLPELRYATLDMRCESHPDLKEAQRLRKEAASLRRQAESRPGGKHGGKVKGILYREAGRLDREAQQMSDEIGEGLLDDAQVICATTTGLDSEIIGRRHFDLAVIDEACQSTEPGCWIPLLRCDRVVLAGDHCQLAPTVISADAQSEGFGVSLFERIHALYGDHITRQLRVQYRMHREIMNFSSGEFYEHHLQPHESVAGHLLADLPEVRVEDEWTTRPIKLIDTSAVDCTEEIEPDGLSKLNRFEAALLVQEYQQLIERGLRPDEIAIIAPYSAQVRLLRQMLESPPGLEVDSVDGFQGREKEAVILSLVRTNDDGEIGFLSEVRRTNVALTRAKRCLIVIGNRLTLCRHPFYERMFAYFDEHNATQTAEQLEDQLSDH